MADNEISDIIGKVYRGEVNDPALRKSVEDAITDFLRTVARESFGLPLTEASQPLLDGPWEYPCDVLPGDYGQVLGAVLGIPIFAEDVEPNRVLDVRMVLRDRLLMAYAWMLGKYRGALGLLKQVGEDVKEASEPELTHAEQVFQRNNEVAADMGVCVRQIVQSTLRFHQLAAAVPAAEQRIIAGTLQNLLPFHSMMAPPSHDPFSMSDEELAT